MSVDVSVIIPAYNSVTYMPACIDSILTQTLGMENIEIIAVDDGSTDGTGELLDVYAETNPQIRVIHQDNTGGPSTPRNRGLDVASGRYVFFLDGDDYLGPEALRRLVEVADEQGTDVVLGRIRGLGGRHSPGSMFGRNQPRTDVFESRVYWTLNPMKLFRRDLIDRLDLRFIPGMSPQEDQPFVATAYLNASGISVVSDYDCVYWREREDGSNLSNSADLESALRIHRVMFPLICDNVAPGRGRDHLLQRHFDVGLFSGLKFLVAEPEGAFRDSSFAQIKQWVDELYNMEIGMRLRPVHRIAYDLLGKGRLDDLKTLFEAHRSQVVRIPVVDNGSVYDPYPFFRSSDIPDECYDITTRTHGRRHLDSIEWNDRVLVLQVVTYLDRIEANRTQKTLVIRKRGTEISYELAGRPRRGVVSIGRDRGDGAQDRIEFQIDPTTCADGEPLENGLWDISVRLESDGFSREGRVGSSRDDAIDTIPVPMVVLSDRGEGVVVTPYYTKDFGNLTLDVGEAHHPLTLSVGDAGWSEQDPTAVEITAQIDARVSSDRVVRLMLRDTDGKTLEVPMRGRFSDGVTRLTGFIVPNGADDGSPLPEGDWRVSIAVDIGDSRHEIQVPAGEGLRTVRWWRGVRPMHFKSIHEDEGALVLRVRRMNLMAALRRRLRLK